MEWALRLALVVALAVALWRSIRPTSKGSVSVSAHAATLDDALRRATTSAHVGAVHVEVDGSVSPAQRDWLAALRRAGVQVEWRGTLPVLAVSAERAREPVSRVRIRLVSDSGAATVVSDSVGVIDSLHARDGASLEASDVVGVVTATRGAYSASSRVPNPAERGEVLVLGRAGWESRFVLAALGEAGWRVRGRLPVAPGVSVVDASLLPIDTARYDAVIALDSTAADVAPAVVRFVRQGGGLLAAGSALDVGALRSLVPARANARHAGRILLEGDTITRRDLPLRPLDGTRADAVVLEREPAGATVAIRRAGRGRVAAVGYYESWRWRMQGGATGEAAHRTWWSRMVGLVAPVRGDSAMPASATSGNAAPRAALVASLGAPSAATDSVDRPASSRLPIALLVLALGALLAETASRRFRGAS